MAGTAGHGAVCRFRRPLAGGGLAPTAAPGRAAPGCPTCRTLVPGLTALARTEPDLDVILISDGDTNAHAAFLAATPLGPELAYVVDRAVGLAYQAGTTPYGVVLDGAGTVRAKGLCNHLQQVESLLNAHATGFASLQHLSQAATHAR